MDGPPGVVVLFFTGDDIQCDSDEETLNEKTDEPVLLKIAMLRTRDVEYVFTAPITAFRLYKKQ